MAIVVNKADPQKFHTSAHTPFFSTEEWLHNPPSFGALHKSVHPCYWKVVGEDIAEMSIAEKEAVDAAIYVRDNADRRAEAVRAVEDPQRSISNRALLLTLNSRMNDLASALKDLQEVFLAIKKTSRVGDIRTVIPSEFATISQRSILECVQDYKTTVTRGDAD